MRAFLLVGALAVTACAPPPAPVFPVRGDADMLAGRWIGEYSSVETRRSGSIEFTLAAGTDTAQGDVLMVPFAQYPYNGTSPNQPVRDMAQPLRIRLVRVFGHQVAGQLVPYPDPDCGCMVTTFFSGRLNGNAIEGVFHTYHDDGRTVTGEWSVKRID